MCVLTVCLLCPSCWMKTTSWSDVSLSTCRKDEPWSVYSESRKPQSSATTSLNTVYLFTATAFLYQIPTDPAPQHRLFSNYSWCQPRYSDSCSCCKNKPHHSVRTEEIVVHLHHSSLSLFTGYTDYKRTWRDMKSAASASGVRLYCGIFIIVNSHFTVFQGFFSLMWMKLVILKEIFFMAWKILWKPGGDCDTISFIHERGIFYFWKCFFFFVFP